MKTRGTSSNSDDYSSDESALRDCLALFIDNVQ